MREQILFGQFLVRMTAPLPLNEAQEVILDHQKLLILELATAHVKERHGEEALHRLAAQATRQVQRMGPPSHTGGR